VSGQPDEQGGATSDHGGLRGAVEALADEWECNPSHVGEHLAHCFGCRGADRLRATLAAHPEPEPAQDGEAGA
jgi:hypothetical protein